MTLIANPFNIPYDGPYRVLQRADKHFTIELGGQKEVVSLDRIRPAYLESSLEVLPSTQSSPTQPTTQFTPPPALSSPVPTTPPGGVTRSGRHVHWPKRFISFARLSTPSLEGA